MDANSLNILVEAKKEYLKQLCGLMVPIMIETFEELYKESVKICKGKKVLLQYQKLLKEVPNWNEHMVNTHNEKLCNTCSWFNDLLAAVFVSFVKILSSVRLKAENKKISIKIPSNQLFIHSCYINAAKDLYKDPYIYHEETNEYERDEKLNKRFIICIEKTVDEMVPVQEILKSCMSQVTDKIELDSLADPDEPLEEPDIDEPGEEEEEPNPEPFDEGEEIREIPTQPQVQQPPTETPTETPKEPQTNEEVLFEDAPEEKKTE